MSIVNKRNAVIGWVTLKVGKRLVRPAPKPTPSRKRVAGKAAAGALTAVGGVLLLRRRKGDGAGEE